MQRTRSAAILPLILIAVLALACGPSAGPAATPTPTPAPTGPPTSSPTPSLNPSPKPTTQPSPSGSPVLDAAAAAARALASDPRLTGIAPRDPDLIGQSAWYEVVPSGDGFKVTVSIGWGDCEAGCIDRHVWVFQVSKDGTVTLGSETGPPLPPGIGGGGGTGPSTLDVVLVAGPVCPVERDPPDPGCAARPVAGATVVVRDASGAEVARGTSDATGHVWLPLPPGSYTVEASPVQGLMGSPQATPVTVAATGTTEVQLAYDSGIR